MIGGFGAEVVELMGLVTAHSHTDRAGVRRQWSLRHTVASELDSAELSRKPDRLRPGWERLVIEKGEYALLAHQHFDYAFALLLSQLVLGGSLVIMLALLAAPP